MHAIGIHGGAGTLSLDDLSVSATRPYREGLERALAAGLDLLERGDEVLVSGLATADVVVVTGQEYLNDGQAVRVVDALGLDELATLDQSE